MNAKKSKLIDDFYAISYLLNDDLDAVCEFMFLKCNERYTLKQLRRYVYNGNYMRLDIEIEKAMDISTNVFKNFKNKQTSIYDFM